MKKKLFLRAAIGFALGMVMFLVICLLFSRKNGVVFFSSKTLLDRVGSASAAVLLQLLVCGFYGSLCMSGTLFYEIERWPLALATAAHYLLVSLGYLLPALLLCWELTAGMLLLIEGIMTVGFFLIWLIMYLLYKAEVRELNELMKKRNKDTEN